MAGGSATRDGADRTPPEPANGNSSPADLEKAGPVVATGSRDGIASYSSGGVGGVNEDAETPAASGESDVVAVAVDV